MTKYLIYFNLLFLSTLCAIDMVKVKLKSGHIGRGEWIGTYSGHIHLLIEDKVYYYACDEILSVMVDDKTNIEEAFVFDCSENTVSSDILFPPEINPMTGEWTQNIPDIFNPDIPKLVKEVKTEVVEIDSSVVNSPKITEKPAKIKENVILFCLILFILFALVKAIVPRYRYDQLMKIGWKIFLPLSLSWVVLTASFLFYFDLLPTN